MTHEELPGLLRFLDAAAALKDTMRSGYTHAGRQEDVAAHSWRVALLGASMVRAFPEVDAARLLKMCLLHDLGEAISGDIPAPEQTGQSDKAVQERADYQQIIAPLPPDLRTEFLELWDEYEAAETPTAQLAKAVDKLETLQQQATAKLPPDFDLGWNLGYARAYTAQPALIAELRRLLDDQTRDKAAARAAQATAEQARPALQIRPAQAKRPVIALENVTVAGFRVKRYGLLFAPSLAREQQLAQAWQDAEPVMHKAFAQVPLEGNGHRLGFVTLHLGEHATWLLVAWWGEECLLYQRMFRRGLEEDRFVAFDHNVIGCTYELAVTAFEREAWTQNILYRLEGPDAAAYLATRLEGMV